MSTIRICDTGETSSWQIEPALITDARDLSSFHPVDVAFAPYDASQLRDILEYRVEQAFYPSALSDEVTPLCAALAAQRNGDARYALDLLSIAADLCEEGRTTVTEEDVRHAERLAEVSLLQRGRASLYIRRCCWKAFTAKRRNSHLLRFIGNSTISCDLEAGNKSHTRRFQHSSLNWNYTAMWG